MPRRSALPLVATLLLSGSALRAEDPSAVAGEWTLNRGLSQDIEAKIKEAAGSEYMAGAPRSADNTWIPWGGTKFGEGERIEVREFLLATVPALQHLEVEVSPREVKTIHGEAGSRIFNLTRSSAGTSVMTGETVARQARWKGPQLILESKGKDSHLTEVITPVPARGQITYALRFEAKLLKQPLDVSLVYDRASGGDR